MNKVKPPCHGLNHIFIVSSKYRYFSKHAGKHSLKAKLLLNIHKAKGKVFPHLDLNRTLVHHDSTTLFCFLIIPLLPI